jgi:hypothetical protein
MDDDIEFDRSFRLFPGVDLTLWFTIVVTAIVSLSLVVLVVWVV